MSYTQSQGVPIQGQPMYGSQPQVIVQSSPQVTVVGGCPTCRVSHIVTQEMSH